MPGNERGDPFRGISAAVIGQAALSGQNTVGWKNNTRAAPPTFTHHALGFLGISS